MKRVPAIPRTEAWNPESPYVQHRLVKVQLANGRSVLFRSKRDAQAFVAEARRFLDQAMLEANQLAGAAMLEHRSAWPILSTGTDTTIRTTLASVVDQLDRATPMKAGPDGLYHAWRHVRNAFELLSHAYRQLEEFYQVKTYAPLRWKMASYRAQCLSAADRMAAYAESPTYGVVGPTSGR